MSPRMGFESEAAEDLGTPPRTGPQLHQLLEVLGSSARPGASAVWSVLMGTGWQQRVLGPWRGAGDVHTGAVPGALWYHPWLDF